MLKVIVLGVAAGGGIPQWNCNCPGCRAARERPELAGTQASIAVSADGRNWFLVNASPDIRQQINRTPALFPAEGTVRHSPITGVILTNGEIDAITGLLSLREGSPFTIYGHRRVLDGLAGNNVFNVLKPELVPRVAIRADTDFEPLLPDGSPSGLLVTPYEVPGKPAWYLEETARATAEVLEYTPGDTLGLHIRERGSERGFHFIAACGGMTGELAERIRGTPLLFFDGTLWKDDEMVSAGLSHKTGRSMGHVPMTGESGAINALAGLGIGRKMFVHINNSNPALRPESPERRRLEAAGWHIPHEGEEITL